MKMNVATRSGKTMLTNSSLRGVWWYKLKRMTLMPLSLDSYLKTRNSVLSVKQD